MGISDRWYMDPDYERKHVEEQKRIEDWRKRKPKINMEELERLFRSVQKSKEAPEVVNPAPEKMEVPEDVPDYGIEGEIERMPGVMEAEIFKSGELGITPVSEEDFVIGIARDAGFEISNQPTTEGYLLAKKGGYIIDLAEVGGFSRIWQGSIDRLVRRESNAEDAIAWVNDKVDDRPVKGYILHY